MNLIKRLFKIGEASINSALDKVENPQKMTDAGIRDLRKNLDNNLKAFAELKATTVKLKREMENKLSKATDYEKKAFALFSKAQVGEIEDIEADRLAAIAIEQVQILTKQATIHKEELAKKESALETMEKNIANLSKQISDYESIVIEMKSNFNVTKTIININNINMLNTNGTESLSLLERMKNKIEDNEALNDAYSEMAENSQKDEKELNNATNKIEKKDITKSAEEALASLKAKLRESKEKSEE
jgi:phage shock protein A